MRGLLAIDSSISKVSITKNLLSNPRLASIPRSTICKAMGVSRSNTYRMSKQEKRDKTLAEQIRLIQIEHPFYGQRRLKLALSYKGLLVNHKRIKRVCTLYNLQARKKKSRYNKPQDRALVEVKIPNRLKPLQEQNLIQRPRQVWCTDFTYISFNGVFYYLATVIDVFTKEIVGYDFSPTHTSSLVTNALDRAVSNYGTPALLHSDQGREFQSFQFQQFLYHNKITQSFSSKSSPWQNSYQESFYSKYKLELELHLLPKNCSYTELEGYLINQIDYYNNYRIHTTIKDIPSRFRLNYYRERREENLVCLGWGA